ncbi:MAG: CPBP family intramembrane metalloprotease [Gammaproteobacteria bacterium]|jgi:membrane protease YdiL (CAAX protease family)|nr:CPBP family intramembrane metalloprotease [Gammaproteobacteria bacterium]MDH3820839.1 CPBP family intramembrane metalloprotease [Gammaproteobacteria bacterium]MDH3842211.1 CPBP family intramembrane metalloprotease [Chromatiales bacterium]MDH4005997.1 CPBP family intramembrane metalloprotease [Gammaproteobacteria bacterium]
MTFADHLFAVVIALIQPVAGYVTFRRLLRRIAAGETINRYRLYNRTIIGQWILFFILGALWLANARPFASLGFTLRIDLLFAAGLTITAIALGLLLMQMRRLSTTEEQKAQVIREQLGELNVLLPGTRSELRRFYGVSLTAGIVEETIWRGFMFWYLGQFMPLWSAATISTIGFALAHAYQGLAKLPRVTVVGATFALIYWLTGSLWLPMLLHAALDGLQGLGMYRLMQRSGDSVSAREQASSTT